MAFTHSAMACPSIMKALIVVSLLAFNAFVSSAYAADIGACAAPAAMTAMLKAEGQRSIAHAHMVTQDKDLRGMIFTMNADRSIGYILQSDQPGGDPAKEICVYQRLANVRLFDARKPTPPEVFLKASDADASRRCDELAKEGKVNRGACGSLNNAIRSMDAHGHRPMLQGFAVEKKSDGSFKPNGALITVSGVIGGSINDYPDDPSRGVGGDIKYSALPDGASYINAVLAFPKYTEYGLSLLK